MESDRSARDDVHVLACAACPRVSSSSARGWEAHRTDELDDAETPALVFYCPECARRVFGRDEP